MSLNIDGEYDIRNINQKSFENEAKKNGLRKGIETQHFLCLIITIAILLNYTPKKFEEGCSWGGNSNAAFFKYG